jgi:hypothetical protein
MRAPNSSGAPTERITVQQFASNLDQMERLLQSMSPVTRAGLNSDVIRQLIGNLGVPDIRPNGVANTGAMEPPEDQYMPEYEQEAWGAGLAAQAWEEV